MFEGLSEKLEQALGKFKEKGKLTPDDIKRGLRDVKLALLEADVNYKVVKNFINRVQERALSSEVMEVLRMTCLQVYILLYEIDHQALLLFFYAHLQVF